MITAKEFKPTSEMLAAARAVFVAMACVETVKPVVRGYQQKILDEMKPVSKMTGLVITEPGLSYQMADRDFGVYHARCNEARKVAGLHVDSDEYCPLLVAKELLRKARRVLVDVMEPVTKIKADNLYVMPTAKCNEFVELTLKLLAPYLKTGG